MEAGLCTARPDAVAELAQERCGRTASQMSVSQITDRRTFKPREKAADVSGPDYSGLLAFMPQLRRRKGIKPYQSY